MESSLSINEVSRRVGLTAYTLRYYERIGLIAPIGRDAGGQRRFARADMDWLEFLVRLRATGMPIRSMQSFAALRAKGDATAGERRAMLESHLRAVAAQIQVLQESAQVLHAKIGFYRQIEQPLAKVSSPIDNHKGNAHDTKPL